MYCSNCDSKNKTSNRFCEKCGAPLHTASQTPSASQPVSHTVKKNSIVLLAGIVVFIAAAIAVYFFFFSGTSITGQWFSEEDSIGMEFSEYGTLKVYSLSGTEHTTYTYTKLKNKGTAVIADKDCVFKAEKGQLVALVDGETIRLTRADEGMDYKAFLMNAISGLWVNGDFGEVLELDGNGAVISSTSLGEANGSYNYNLESGEGNIALNGTSYPFTADKDTLYIPEAGQYEKADEDFDIAAFLEENPAPIVGKWYEQTGTYGTFEFLDDGTFNMESYGKEYTGIYMFAQGTGMAIKNGTGETWSFCLSDDVLILEEKTYTRYYVEQSTSNSHYDAIKGYWYGTAGNESVIYFSDTSIVYVDIEGVSSVGLFTFDPFNLSGYINYNASGNSFFYIDSDGVLVINDTTFTRADASQ